MNMTFKQKDEIIDILENLPYWDTCPQDYKDRIPELVKALNQVNNGVLDDVMALFKPNELWRMAQKYNCDDFTQMIEQSKGLNKL